MCQQLPVNGRFSRRECSIFTEQPFIKQPRRIVLLSAVVIATLLPIHQASANPSIANAVLAACAPNPTVPDVSSCSACHSTTNNRGPNDLTAAGQWALSSATYTNFCPNTTPAPDPNPTPTPDPNPTPPTTGMGMGSQPPSSGMGMGIGGDDDDDYEDDDGGGSASGFRSRFRSSESRRSSRRSRD